MVQIFGNWLPQLVFGLTWLGLCHVAVRYLFLYRHWRRERQMLVRLARRRAQRAGESMRLLRMSEEIARLGIWEYFPQQQRQVWSPGMKQLFGLDPAEALLPGDAETLFAANGLDLVGQVMANQHRRGAFPVRFAIQLDDGSQRLFCMRACHFRESDSSDHRVVGVVIDQTDLARRERRMKAAQEQAEKAAREARQLAETDPLTGIANRRRIMAELDRMIVAARRADTPLSLIALDIDHFKHVNDHHGHPAGDAMLKRIAAIMSEQARECDLIGRLGGEEFIWVLPGADRHYAQVAAERLRLAVALGSGTGPVPPVTISIGIASLIDGDTGLSLFARADAALYEAKHSGRNQVRQAA